MYMYIYLEPEPQQTFRCGTPFKIQHHNHHHSEFLGLEAAFLSRAHFGAVQLRHVQVSLFGRLL